MAVDNMFFTDYEPKTKNRFILNIDGFDSYIVRSSGRPQLQSTRREIDYINTKRYVAGKYSWQPLDVTFMDPIVPSGTQRVMEWMRLHHQSETGVAGYKANYTKEVKLNMLGPDGTFVEEWVLKNTFIENANFNDVDYSSDELADITITLSYDYATLNF